MKLKIKPKLCVQIKMCVIPNIKLLKYISLKLSSIIILCGKKLKHKNYKNIKK